MTSKEAKKLRKVFRHDVAKLAASEYGRIMTAWQNRAEYAETTMIAWVLAAFLIGAVIGLVVGGIVQ